MADKRFLQPTSIIYSTSAPPILPFGHATTLAPSGNMGANITSLAQKMEYLDNVGIQITWGSATAPVGTYEIQVSNDYVENDYHQILNAGNWTTVPVSDTSGNPLVPSGSAGTILVSLNQLPWKYLRVIYSYTSGTGGCSVTITGKGI